MAPTAFDAAVDRGPISIGAIQRGPAQGQTLSGPTLNIRLLVHLGMPHIFPKYRLESPQTVTDQISQGSGEEGCLCRSQPK